MKDNWISVKARLPAYEQRVLLYGYDTLYYVMRFGAVVTGYRASTDGAGQKYVLNSYKGSETIRNITHWMPLPSPPKK